jgi:hypothetical protein
LGGFSRLYKGVSEDSNAIDDINKKEIADFFENEERLNGFLYNFWRNLGGADLCDSNQI